MMMQALDFISGGLAGLGVVLILYVLVTKAEAVSFWPRFGLAAMCAGIMLNTPKEMVGWDGHTSGDWTYILGRVGFALFLWFAVWPLAKNSRLFNH